MDSFAEGDMRDKDRGQQGNRARVESPPDNDQASGDWAHVPCIETRLERVACEILEERALFLDLNHLVGRSLGLMELQRRSHDGGAVPETQIRDGVEEAIKEQLLEDYRRMKAGHLERCQGNDRDDYLVTEVGVRASCVYSAVVAYNALRQKERRAFMLGLRRNVEFADLVGTEWDSLEEVIQDFLTALAALLVRPLPTP